MNAQLELELLELEEDITRKVSSISQNMDSAYHMRVVKTQQKTLSIYYRPLLSRSFREYISPDRLAHLLSLVAARMPEEFFRAIKHLILIPELVLGPKQILSHNYIPEKQALAFYLIPESLLPNQFNWEDIYLNRGIEKRFNQNLNQWHLLKLWSWVFTRIIDCRQNNSKQNHIFLIPRSCLRDLDILRLQEIHDLYAKYI